MKHRSVIQELTDDLLSKNLMDVKEANTIRDSKAKSIHDLVDLLNPTYGKETIIAVCKFIARSSLISEHDDLQSTTGRILELLDVEDTDIRLEAVIALGNLRAFQAYDALIDRAFSDDNDSVKIMAIKSIERLEIQESAEPLMLIAQDNNQSIEVRETAIEALGATKKDAPLEILFELLEHPSARIRWASIVALHNLRNPIAIPYLKKLLEDDTQVFQDITIQKEVQETIEYLTTLSSSKQ